MIDVTLFSSPKTRTGRRIGLLGGSFNPAHGGHLHVASTALKRLGLSEVWFVIARGNPLKSEHGDYDDRRRSVSRIVDGYNRFDLCNVEAEHKLIYTIDTISILQHIHRGDRFVWIMGSDNLASFHHWRAWQEIAGRIPLAVIARPGSRPGKSVFEQTFASARIPERSARRLAALSAPAWVYLKAPFHPVSSTALRGE
ncbi:MAG: nicotinate (nicotinamide) nucleotide adenylyltransferase [Pseudomonadota bacterium]